ncbi:MAG: hypothetical protein VB778_00565 [Nitrospinaceae bacterium]
MSLTGLAMGWVVHSPLLMVVAGGLGLVIGGFIGWLGGQLFITLGVGHLFHIIWAFRSISIFNFRMVYNLHATH